jgi:hypothetical protein
MPRRFDPATEKGVAQISIFRKQLQKNPAPDPACVGMTRGRSESRGEDRERSPPA